MSNKFYKDFNIKELVAELQKAAGCQEVTADPKICINCNKNCTRRNIIANLQVSYSFKAENYLRSNACKWGISDPLDISRLHDELVDSVVISANKYDHSKTMSFNSWVWGLWSRKILEFLRNKYPGKTISLDILIGEDSKLLDLIEDGTAIHPEDDISTQEVHPLDHKQALFMEEFGELNKNELYILIKFITEAGGNVLEKKRAIDLLLHENTPVVDIDRYYHPTILLRRNFWKSLSESIVI